MKNIYAHTENGPSFPGYVSINDEGGVISITVRTRGAQTGGHIVMSREDLAAMCAAGAAYVNPPVSLDKPADIDEASKRKPNKA